MEGPASHSIGQMIGALAVGEEPLARCDGAFQTSRSMLPASESVRGKARSLLRLPMTPQEHSARSPRRKPAVRRASPILKPTCVDQRAKQPR